MKLFTLTRSLLAFSLAAALTACGGTEPEADRASPIVAHNQMAEAPTAQGGAAQVPAAQGAVSQPTVYLATEPVPDCAPENCSGLRIIDANAEEYRLRAMERKQLDEAGGGV
jgi:hypothetical protein